MSDLWPGPPPSFPSLGPESHDEHDHFFRCPDCGELFAVGMWLRNGDLIECDVRGCNGQFYAVIQPPSRGRA